MNNLSIKTKLLIYSFFIQLIILVIFSFSLYKALNISTIDKLNSNLRVILLDVVDDIIENKDNLSGGKFNENEEYKFEPLYMRLLKLEPNSIKIIKSTKYPNKIKEDIDNLKLLEKQTIVFEKLDNYIISKIKININGDDYVVEVSTHSQYLNQTLENLLYVLFFIVPIILILSTIGGYFLIYKSFLPIENILQNLRTINTTDLSRRLEIPDNSNNNNDEIYLLTKEINSLLTRIEISFDKISQFSSDASHELKTPLTIVRGEIEVALMKNRTKEEYKEVLNSSLDEVIIIQQTINDLLFLAKSQQNLKPIKADIIYIDNLFSDVVKELDSYAKLKNIKVDISIHEIQDFQGYYMILKIAVKNILKNAISFSDDNSTVILTSNIENNHLLIIVEDFGIGIAKHEQQKIFDNFYRTEKSRNKDVGGTGLGMAICEKIVKIHNGTIVIKSQEHIGTKVIISIPIIAYTDLLII